MNEIVLRTVKSSLRSDEIFSLRLQMKLNPPISPAARQISSTAGGFLPPTADLTEKSRLLSQSAFFLAHPYKIDPYRKFF